MFKIGYTINPSKTTFMEFDESKFKSEVQSLGEKGYEFEQDFEGNDIGQIRSITVANIIPSRIDDVAKLYGISPSEVRITDSDEIEYTFRFVSPLVGKRGYSIGRNLADLYDGEYRLYTRWKEQCKSVDDKKLFIIASDISQIFSYSPISDSINEGNERSANILDVEEVARRLKFNSPLDILLNQVPFIGPNFHLAVHVLGSIQSAYKFFNNEFNIGFIEESIDSSTYIADGKQVVTAGIYASPNGAYFRTGGQNGQDIKMTNFLISVHYKLIRPSNDAIFMVTMTNEQGQKVEHIEWKNSSSETQVLDSIMKYGNFHVYGGKNSILKLHEMVTRSSVPTIYGYAQYGYNEYKGNEIMIFPDGVFDMSNRKFFPKHETLPYTFLGGHDGISFENGIDGGAVPEQQIPRFGEVTKNKLADYIKITKNIYSDDSAYIVWMIACSMAGVAAYYHQGYVPSYYVSGVTGSGKSTMAKYISSAFGVESLYNIRESTLYPVKILLSAFKGLPAFFSEFRTEMRYADDKMGLIQMCYDRATTSKGLKNGGTIHYKMESQVFCEGEDTYDEGSIRSRSIMHEAKKSSRVEGSIPLQVLSKHRKAIHGFFATYLKNTCKQDYTRYLTVGQRLFAKPGIEPRLSDNIGIMYAGCMTFAPDMEDDILRICKSMLDSQVRDYQVNGESQKIISLIAQYVDKRWSTVHCQDGYIIINWNDINEYRNRYKQTNMKLSTDAYLGHLLSLGWESNFYEVDKHNEFGKVEKIVVKGIRIPVKNAPRDLFTNSEIYAYYKEMTKEKK